LFSAYLNVYNDREFLLQALRSIAPYVDEVVVVDGAYERLAPYLSALGHDLVRSDERVYDAIESSGIPYRVVSRVWANQIEKRLAGYEQCTRRHVLRFDADEIFFADDNEIDRFLSRGGAVGKVEMPTYIAPG
jgi:glycosyltransferase involved in cell wall biosynthesis